MRTVQRPRHYVARHWVMLLRPMLRYSSSRDAFVLHGVGNTIGPVLRVDRRRRPRPEEAPFTGLDRRARTV